MARLTIYFMKIIIALLTALLATSCNIKIDGFEDFEAINPQGNVVIKEVELNSNFENIKVSNGLNVFLTQDANTKVSIEAEENLHQYIQTYVENNTLYIKKNKNFSYKATKNIYVSTPIISGIKASSASEVVSKNTINSKNLDISTSSGATINLAVIADKIQTDASSGSQINVTGKAISYKADASSGASIYTESLITKDCFADVSSGASIKVNTLNELDADASSGGSILHNADVKSIKLSKSSGGSISSY